MPADVQAAPLAGVVEDGSARTAADLRGQTRTQVLRLLLALGPLSRAELALRTGLNPGSVTRIVRELIDSGLLVETGTRSEGAGVGRPSMLVDLDAGHSYVAAIHLGIQLCRVALLDLRGRMIARMILPNDLAEPLDAVAGQCAAAVDRLVAEHELDRSRLIAAGVGAAGWVDGSTGQLVEHANGRWRDYPLRDHFRTLLKVATAVDSAVRATTLVEWWLGAGAGTRNLLLLFVGSTIGAGLVVDGRLVRGNLHAAGQLGHVVVDPDGPPCACGSRGCLEAVGSNVAILERAVTRKGRQFVDPLGDPDPFSVLCEAARSGETWAADLLRERAHSVGLVLANAVNVLAPECVVVAGLYAPEVELPVLEAALRAGIFPPIRDAVRLTASQFGGDAALVGAGSLALRLVFSPRLQVVHQRTSRPRAVVKLPQAEAV